MRTLVACLFSLMAFTAPAPAHPGAYVAKFLGEYLAGKALDGLFADGGPSAEERVKELHARMAAYESLLRRVDGKMADEVAALRKELGTKTTAARVREVVKKTLGELDARVKKLEAGADRLENRQDKIDERVKQIEELFGHVPTVPPSPLLMSSVEAGEPKAHPLTLRWLRLLSRSERGRQELEGLRRTRPDTSKAVAEALAKDKGLLAETKTLHDDVKVELARRLADRQELLREYKPGAAKVRAFDEEMASVTWLMAVTRPIPKGPHAGRLGMPPALFGPQGSEIVLACKLAGVDPAEIADLYRRQLVAEGAREGGLFVTPPRAPLAEKLVGIGAEAKAAVSRGMGLMRRAERIEKDLQAALKDYSTESPEVRALRGERAVTLKAARKLHEQFAELSKRGSERYVEAMEKERPTNARMTAFRLGVLLPLAAWESLVSSEEEADPRTWKRLAGSRIPGVVTIDAPLDGYLEWSPDGKWLAAKTVNSDRSRAVKVWEADTGKEVVLAARGDYSGLLWSPDGKHLAALDTARAVKVWDVPAGTCRTFPFPQKEEKLIGGGTIKRGAFCYQMAWSPDGKHLAAPGRDGVVRVVEAATGEVARAFVLFPGGPDGPNFSADAAAAWSPDGKRLAGTGKEGKASVVKVWDAEAGKELFAIKGTAFFYHSVWSPDGRRLAGTNTDDGVVKVWDAATGKELLALEVLPKGRASASWSPDGKWLAGTGWSEEKKPDATKVWDAATGKEGLALTGARLFQWSPDGLRFTGMQDGRGPLVWEIGTGKRPHPLDGASQLYAAWSPDGRRLAGCGRDGTVQVWDAATGKKSLTLKGHKGVGLFVAWSPDGNRLASVGYRDGIKVWLVAD